jgi:hypothetical protein
MTRWSAITRTPPQLLRARQRLALHSSGGEDLNRLVQHERRRYSGLLTLEGRALLVNLNCIELSNGRPEPREQQCEFIQFSLTW